MAIAIFPQKIGILSSPVAGHVYALAALGRALQRRGHEIFFFSLADTGPLVAAEGLRPVLFGAGAFPAGSWEHRWRRVSRSSGWRAGLQTLLLHRKVARAAGRDIPSLIHELGLTAMLIDENQIYGRGLAERAGIPFASVAGTIPLHRAADGTRPPPIFSWRPGAGPGGFLRWRNRAGFWAMDLLGLAVSGLGSFPASIEASLSRELRLRPFTEEFDWEDANRTGSYVGHFVDPARHAPYFPFDRLPAKRPLIFASLGTIHNGRREIYSRLVESVRGLPVTLVISEGRWREAQPKWRESGNVIVASYVPQLGLLERASVVITHGGVHSIAESLYYGRPMLVLPQANDQPGGAARVAAAGCGIALSDSRVGSPLIRAALQRLLSDPAFAQNARALSEKVRAGGGPEAAAGLVERWLENRRA